MPNHVMDISFRSGGGYITQYIKFVCVTLTPTPLYNIQCTQSHSSQVPAQNENEEKILGSYENIFEEFNSVLEKFGVEKVVCLGQPFDFNFMEVRKTYIPISQFLFFFFSSV